MIRKIILAILLVGAAAAAFGLYQYNKKPASLENKTADLEVKASEMLADFEADENVANEKYLGKVVAVEGKVEMITDEGGKKKIHLSTENPMSVIICEMAPDANAEVAGGDQVVVKGKCTGYLTDVVLVESHLSK